MVQHLNRSYKKRIRRVYGYNEHALKAYLMMNGYKPNATSLISILEINKQTAWNKMTSGKFKRGELCILKDTLNLNSEQFCDVFFSGVVHCTGNVDEEEKGKILPRPTKEEILNEKIEI